MLILCIHLYYILIILFNTYVNRHSVKIITRDKEDHYVRIQVSVYQKDITIVNINAANMETSKYII